MEGEILAPLILTVVLTLSRSSCFETSREGPKTSYAG